MAEIIDLALDSPQKGMGSSNANVIELIDATCASCNRNGGEFSPLLRLTLCGHVVHYKCCLSQSSSGPGDASAKRRKRSPNRGVQNPLISSESACAVCATDLDWRDHAAGC